MAAATSPLNGLAGLTVAQITDKLKRMSPTARAAVTAALGTIRRPIWFPLPGPQRLAFKCQADITGYGGAAGGGKTDLACGLALTEHQRSIIFRREGKQLIGVIDRMAKILGTRDGLNNQDKVWRLPDGRVCEFGGFPNPGDESSYQGRPHDLLVFDEVTEMLERQVRFLMGWCRTEVEGQRTRILMTMNPPTTAEGRWVIKFFAPWLDDKHPNPAAEGELRWFTTIADEDREVLDDRPFVVREDGSFDYDFDPSEYEADRAAEVIRPQSRTFIFARVTDNPYYMDTGYASKLQAMPEPLRSQMLYGDFRAGMKDDAMQIIPTAWIDAAMDRWEAHEQRMVPVGPMDSLGVDAAMGGEDKFIISARHGRWFAELIEYAGEEIKDGNIGASRVLAARRDRAPVHVDVVGWGAGTYSVLAGNDIQVIPVNGAEGTEEIAVESGLRFANTRARLHWRLREQLDPRNPNPIMLPPDTILRADLAAPRWYSNASGIHVELKKDIKKRIGRSPDRGDAVMLALEATLKAETLIEMQRHMASAISADPYADLGLG